MRGQFGGGGGVFYTVLALSLFATLVTGECGFPGTPTHGYLQSPAILPQSRLWSPGEEVTYACQPGFVLFGELKRHCFANSTWSGIVPTCDYNIARGQKATLSNTFYNYTASLVVDGLFDTCAFTPRTDDGRWWQVHLGDTYAVAAVAVTITAGLVHKFTVFVVHVGAAGKLIYESCGTFDGVFENNTVVVVCNEGRGQTGQLIFIRDDRSILDYFGLCEVEVFERRDGHSCGEPETPSYGDTVVIDPDGLVEFYCWVGRRLIGDRSHVCLEGRWMGTVPACVEITCEPPAEIPDGVIHVMTPSDDIIVGAVATHECDEGYVLLGNGTRVCGDDGHWTGTAPLCDLVDCGLPPKLANGVVHVNSTSWKTVGLAVCHEGFIMTGDQAHVLCDSDGRWHLSNVSCQESYVAMETDTPDPVNTTEIEVNVTTITPALIGTSFVLSPLETEPNVLVGVLVGSIVAVISVMALILLLAFLRRKWRRRSDKDGMGNDVMRDGRGAAYSNSHLVDDGDEPIYDDIYANSGYRNDPLYADTLVSSTATTSADEPQLENQLQRIYDDPADSEPIYYTPVEFPKEIPLVPTVTVSRVDDEDETTSAENPLYEALDPRRLDGAVYAQIDLQKKKKDREESFRRQRESGESPHYDKPAIDEQVDEDGEDRLYENVELEGSGEHRPLPPIPSETSLIAMEESVDNELYSSVAPDEPEDDDKWEKSESIYAAPVNDVVVDDDDDDDDDDGGVQALPS